uniref:Transposase (Putative), gypsy type n=1 Tax=Tanacetum cinerariifolium TaxID=118510 RepID=A0A6L2MSF8_TANCI|nr:hypothetical protein [Tanacetum cinerariifolium]
MGRDTVQLETTVSTIAQEYLLEFTSEYGILEALHPKLLGPEDRIVDFPEGKVRPRFPKKLEQSLLLGGREGVPDYCGLAYECSKRWDANREYVFPKGCDNTEHTPYPNPETTRGTTLLSRVKPQILPGRRDMDLFNLIRAPNPTKVKTGIRPLDWARRPGNCGPGGAAPENVTTMGIAPEAGPAERVAATDPPAFKERRKRGHDEVDINAPPKVLRRDHADPRPTESTHEGKSLAAIELRMGSIRPTPAPQCAPVDVSDPDPLSYFKGAAAAEDPKSENTSFASMVGSPGSIYRPDWGITNGSMLDAPEACQDLVDHIAPPGYFLELRHLHNDDFLKQYNVNLARQVAMGSQLRLRFGQEAKLLKKSVAQVARRDKRIQARENEIKNLETLLEAEADMKKAVENKSAELNKELETMRALFSDLQVSNNHLSQQVSTLQEQVSGEEKLKAAFEEFKWYEDDWVEQRCAEMDARLDALSTNFDEELYPHMLTAIVGRRWMIGRRLRLAVMKCGESTELRQVFADVVSAGIAKGMNKGLKHRVEHEQAKLDLEAIEANDPEAEAKYIAALHALKNLKYPLVDQLETLEDASMDVIMASLHLEKVRDPMDPWACKEEILLADAIAANVGRAEKKKNCHVVCRTHGVGSAHHARSDGVLVSLPTVAPQGLDIFLANAATQTETPDEASPQLLRSSSLPIIHG